MEKEQHIYEHQGMEEYIKYQVEHEMQPFTPGPAFSFVKVRGWRHKWCIEVICLVAKNWAVNLNASVFAIQFNPTYWSQANTLRSCGWKSSQYGIRTPHSDPDGHQGADQEVG